MTLVAFSLLFTLNIAMSNVSLAVVSVQFHQSMRSTGPVYTMLIYQIFFRQTFPMATYLSIIPVVFGIGLATAGDRAYTMSGFWLSVLGMILASAKTIWTNRLMTGIYSPMELLLFMSGLAALQCVVFAFMTSEIERFRLELAAGNHVSPFSIAALLVNASFAFLLNVISFQTNKVMGALTMTVCANVKQALTIILGILLFDIPFGTLNAVGMMITIGGAAWYSKIELDSKRG